MSKGDDLSDAAAARVERIRLEVGKEIVRIIRKAQRQDGTLGDADTEQLATLRTIRDDMTALLRAKRPLVLALADRDIKAAVAPFDFAPRAAAQVRSQASGALDSIPDAFSLAMAEIRDAVDSVANAPVKVEPFIRKVAARMDVPFVRARVAVQTAVMGAWRLSTVARAESGAKEIGEVAAFLYLGPDDSKCRPFCAAHVGRVYKAKDIARMNNGQGLEVRTFAGGYNCRHVWSPISLEEAAAEGYAVG